MFNRFRLKTGSVLGIDLSPNSVKILELSLSKENPVIESYACRHFYSETDNESKFYDWKVLNRLTQDLIHQLNSSTQLAAVSVPDSLIISKTIQLESKLSDREIEHFILHEAKKCLGVVHEKIKLDFGIIKASQTNSDLKNLWFVACKSEEVDGREKIIKNANLHLKFVDIESFAVVRVFDELFAKQVPDFYHSKAIVYIELGYQTTRFVIFDETGILFTREANFGLHLLVELACIRYQLARSEAYYWLEQRKKINDYEYQITDPFINDAVLNFKKGLQFFFPINLPKSIEKIYLAGEFYDLDRLVHAIEKETAIPTEVANPLNYLTCAERVNLEEFKQVSPSFVVALGLALRQFDEN